MGFNDMPLSIETSLTEAASAAEARDLSEHDAIAQALEEARTRFLQLAENIPACFWLVDIAECRVVFANAAYENVWGRKVADLYWDRMDWLRAIHPGDALRVSELLGRHRRGGMDTEFRVLHGTEEVRWLHMRTFGITGVEGVAHSVGGVAYDITDLVSQREALRTSENHQRQALEVQKAILDALPAHVAILDAEGRISAINAQWRAFSGGNAGDGGGEVAEGGKVGDNYLDLCTREAAQGIPEAEQVGEAALEIIAGTSNGYCLVYPSHTPERQQWFRVNLTPLHNEPPHGVLVTQIDITERMLAEQQLTQLAHYDSLTALPNRLLFRDRLHSGITIARRNSWQLAVLFIDLDRFKSINDTLGHAAGDTLLQHAARRIQTCIRESDTVGRLGGDEFAIVLTELAHAHDAGLVARKVVDVLARPFTLEGQEVFITASIGITLFPADGDDDETLVRNADTAMYRAKDLGRHNYQFFTAEMNRQATADMQLENDLRRAVKHQEFALVYQPKASCVTGRIVGFEALLRWHHPRRGLVPPNEFIGSLEETGLIVEVGEWVLRTACREARALHLAGLGFPSVAVNLSARQLQSENLFDLVQDALEESGLEPRYLELELTESFLMNRQEMAIATLSRLKTMGIHISVDDFGTGYSSLSYLKRLPIDCLKVDRSFVQDITADPNDASITRAIIKLAHSLKLSVVAEGVESEGQLGMLIANKCDVIQGYYFSRPVPLKDLHRMLAEGKCLPGHLLAGERAERTLMLVDDEANVLSSLRRLLRQEGYRILTAGSGEEALEILATQPADVVVSDQRMPGMSGAEFLSRVRDIYPDTVRLVLSGFSDLEALTDAINQGSIYKFIAKPWDDEALRRVLRDAFHARELVGESQRLGMELQRSNAELERLNQEMQRALEERTEQNSHKQTVLGITHDILQTIPLPVIGLDDEGLIAAANEEAERLFAGELPLFGSNSANRLPTEMTPWLADTHSEAPFQLSWKDTRFAVTRRPMTPPSNGTLLFFQGELSLEAQP
jgi:diguanylate cyclase (GGDEF)-like protein